MLDLAIDTSSSVGSIALGNAQVTVQAIELRGPRRHSAALFPALTRLGVPRLKLNRIIVGLWDPALDAERIRERLTTCRPDSVVNNLALAIAVVRDWQRTGLYPELVLHGSPRSSH